MGEENTRAKCVVCGEEQVDVAYLDPVPNGEGKTLHVGFPVCYEHELHDLAIDHYVFSDVIVDVIADA